MSRSISVCLAWLGGSVVAGWVGSGTAWADVTAQRVDAGVRIQVDGQPFAEYRVDVNGTPAVWPIIGPTGKPMTRAFPMADQEGERKDHPHHRSLWFNHGSVNGQCFWIRNPIKHREFVEVSGGAEAVVVTRNDWVLTDGTKICEDQRRLVFGADADRRWIDFDVTLRASEGPLTFGDTKEGSFGIRVAETIKVDAKLGGRIVNSEGQEDGAAWGKRAAWVDYSGPVDGQRVGIAVLNHPASFRYPTYWHVRTYGLFAANPFGVHDFTGGKEPEGTHTVPAGESIRLIYRVLLHRGDEKEGRVAEAFKAFAAEKK